MSKVKLTTSEAIAELRGLIAEIENLKKSSRGINQANEASFSKMENSISSLRGKVSLLGNKLNYLEAVTKKQAEALKQYNNETNKASKASNKLEKQTEKTTQKLKKQERQASANGKAFKGMMGSFSTILSGFGLYLGLQAVGQVLKTTYQQIKVFDSLAYTMDKVTDTSWELAQSQSFLFELTEKYGVELVTTSNRWIKFSAAAKNAGLSLEDTRNIFESMTKASSVLGLKTDELRGVYLALEQMLSKGKITTEELRRQLGERLPGAMGIMAASMGVTIPELDKMLKKGEVLSAEVLPNFARAVETAYGIDKVEKVENLNAAQNRLTSSWQRFIQHISEGDSVISKVIGGALNYLARLIYMLDYITTTQRNRDLMNMPAREKEVEDHVKRMAETSVNLRVEFEKTGNQLKKKISDLQLQIASETNEKEQNQLKKHLNKLRSSLVEYNDKVRAQQRVYASERFKDVEAQYLKDKKLYDEYLEEMDKPVKASDIFNIMPKITGVEYRNLEKFTDEQSEIIKNFSDLEAKYNVFRRLIQTTDINFIPSGGDGSKVIEKRFEEIRDLSKDLQIEILKSQNDAIEQRIENEETGWTADINMTKKMMNNKLRIVQLSYEIEIEKIKIAERKKIEEVEKALEQGKTSTKKAEDQIRDIKNESYQKQEISFQNFLQGQLDEQAKVNKELEKIIGNAREFEVAKAKEAYDEKIIKINQEYEASKRTAKDRKKRERELAIVAVQSANAQIEAQIKLLEAKKALLDLDDEALAELEAQIKALRALLQQAPSGDDGTEAWKNYFMSILDYAKEFNQALGDLIDNLFERRIENINAEIEAEREKYDTLIKLAEGDDEQQKTLQRNKEVRIKRLEKERLKEQQKQAKARKAFAIADIGISTAQAIMGIWAQFPKFDFGISAGLMTAFVSALGALQIAAVAAQPIPQYKEGADNIEKEHIGMINDGLAQEYIERNNKILTTKRKNSLVHLQPGDTIYKNFNDMVSRSKVFDRGLGGQYISENDFNRLFTTIDGSIKSGFKNAKIQNNILVNKQDNSNNYGQKLSKWN